MNFDFMPYQLNADISYFKDSIVYIDSDNGVDLYKARDSLKKPILGIPVVEVNLYFFEANMITVYIRLKEKVVNAVKVKDALDKAIRKKGEVLKTNTGQMFVWQSKSCFLGLLIEDSEDILRLYFTLNRYNIFNQ